MRADGRIDRVYAFDQPSSSAAYKHDHAAQITAARTTAAAAV
jgi:hypothetical protein